MLLAVAQERGLGAAALIQAVRVIASICSTPLRARVLDRFGRRFVVPQTLVTSASLVGFALTAADSRNAIAVPLTLILVQTLTAPAMDAVIRSEWRQIGRNAEEVKSLHAADSVLEESGYLLGPVLVGALELGGSPAMALTASVTLVVAGALTVFAPTAVRTALQKPVAARPLPPTSQSGRVSRFARMLAGPIATHELQRIVLPLLFMGTSFGVLGILIPLAAAEAGVPDAAGFLFGAISLGGLIGAFAYGALRLKSPLSVRQAALTLVVGLPLLPVSFLHHPIALGAMLVAAGLAVTPLYINSYLMMDDGLPESVIHEANTWVPVAYNIGYSIGILAAGFLAGTGAAGVSLAVGGFAAVTAAYALGVLIKSRQETAPAVQEA
jgi:hypothetical protein